METNLYIYYVIFNGGLHVMITGSSHKALIVGSNPSPATSNLRLR